MRERTLRRRCRGELRALDIRPPLDVRELCARLAERRGHPIHLRAHPLEIGVFGLWLGFDAFDVILYQAETTRTHQDHIILHEIGHMLAEHPSDEQDMDALAFLMPHIPREHLSTALRRTSYEAEQEREAELVATIILEWASVLEYSIGTSPSDAADREIAGALGDRQGWL